MSPTISIRPAQALPPLRLPTASRRRSAPFRSACLGRCAFGLAALALPALGIGLADPVHRTAGAGVQQAAVRPAPSGRTAASRTDAPIREAALRVGAVEGRP